jgi:hypothetical protein
VLAGFERADDAVQSWKFGHSLSLPNAARILD